jgi:hypothetical protein
MHSGPAPHLENPAQNLAGYATLQEIFRTSFFTFLSSFPAQWSKNHADRARGTVYNILVDFGCPQLYGSPPLDLSTLTRPRLYLDTADNKSACISDYDEAIMLGLGDLIHIYGHLRGAGRRRNLSDIERVRQFRVLPANSQHLVSLSATFIGN